MARLDVLLEQSTWWVTRERRRVRIDQMEPSHAFNTAAMLRRNAAAGMLTVLQLHHDLRTLRSWGDVPDEVEDDLVRELAERDTVDWLEEQPLMRALRARAASDPREVERRRREADQRERESRGETNDALLAAAEAYRQRVEREQAGDVAVAYLLRHGYVEIGSWAEGERLDRLERQADRGLFDEPDPDDTWAAIEEESADLDDQDAQTAAWDGSPGL